MANAEQLAILKQGVKIWNEWRKENLVAKIELSPPYIEEATTIIPANLMGADLRGAHLAGIDLSEAQLCGTDLTKADLSKADLTRADLWKADLSEANLTGASLTGARLNVTNLQRANFRGARMLWANFTDADLSEVDLSGADLSEAILTNANLRGANLRKAKLLNTNLRETNLSSADLMGVNLTGASLVETIIEGAKVSGSSIYGVSVWRWKGEFEEQEDLVITCEGEPIITVDNIEVAQFIYLILNNEKIRRVINTLTSKSVLILGRFALPERKTILDALRNKLREYNLLPIVFDFDRPTHKDFTETIKTLAGLSYFVIADITNPKSSPLELQATVPDYQIPFVPIIQAGERPFAMMVDLQKKYNWVLDTLSYDSIDALIHALKSAIIDPAIEKHNELKLIKARESRIRSATDFLEK